MSTSPSAESTRSTRRVWGIGTSRTLRVHWMLAELGLDYEIRPVMPRHPSMDDSEFRERSQRGKVPIYEEDGIVMGESGASRTDFQASEDDNVLAFLDRPDLNRPVADHERLGQRSDMGWQILADRNAGAGRDRDIAREPSIHGQAD